VRFEPDDACPPFVAVGVAFQGVLLILAPIIVIVAVSAFASGRDDTYLTWAVFAALTLSGLVTILQAAKLRRVGLGHVLITGVTPNYIAVSILALAEGGPGTLASLIVFSSLFYMAIARWLPLLRRVVTPAVSGTVLMLIAILLLHISFDRLQEVPVGAPAFAGPVVAAVTLAVTTSLALRGPRAWRIWSPLIGIAVGCASAIPFGLYDLRRLIEAPWFGIPDQVFPGLDFTPTAGFWVLLPMFLVVTLVQAIKAIGDGVVVQQVGWRRPRATDFRLIQGTLYASGLGMLLSGLAGTPPTTAYSSSTVSLVSLTGVAARRVGYSIGSMLVLLALLPKVTGLLLTIPSPVMGAFLLIAIGMLFVEGLRTVTRGGLDAQTALIVGLAFALGVGFGQHDVFSGILSSPWSLLLGNGITAGAATAIGLTMFLSLTKPRPRKLEARLDIADLPRVDAFLQAVAGSMKWNESSTERLRSAGEETVSILLSPADAESTTPAPRLLLSASPEGQTVELEFVAASDEENLADRLAYLSEQNEVLDERDLPFRLLRHFASSVRHQKYQGIDIITVRVEGSP
jgi:NCS2 family nucleobase:cation symporter-2/xanthine permease XanP